MKRIISIILAVCMMFALLTMTASAAEAATIGFESKEAEKGETVSLELHVTNNPGIAGLAVSLKYDTTVLTLKETKRGRLFSGFTAGKNFAWDESEDVTADGVLATFVFEVAENAEPGDYSVNVIIRSCTNENLGDVECAVQGGVVTVKGGSPVAAVYENGTEKAQYSDFGKAAEGCGANGYVKLLCDTQVDVTLTKDLYVDLNGFDLSGTLTGGKVYGMDSTTNSYNCENRGVFNCKNASGAKVVPETHFKSAVTGSIKRYMAIEEQSGYSFHRFYLGVTHMSVRPAVTSVGFKATFYGDEMVVAALDSENAYGYSLELTGGTSVEVYKGRSGFVSGQPVTLRIDNYDVENQGETVLTGKAVLKLQDGTVIESSGVTMTLRQLLEGLNANPAQMTAQQLAAVKKMIQKYEIIQSWKVENLI